MSALLRAHNLSRGYREGDTVHQVLDALDLELTTGEHVALIGESGSGKSTLLNLLSGIDLPDHGTIDIGDTALHACSEGARTRWRRRHLGLVFQFFELIPTLTVRENVLLPLELNRLPQLRPNALARLETLRLSHRLDCFPEQLSGGEQQRVAIARALAHEPDLVLADEPTGNLDPDTADEVLNQLREAGTGRTVLIVTHSMQVAHSVGRCLRLEHGRLHAA